MATDVDIVELQEFCALIDSPDKSLFDSPITFGERFMQDHAGGILSDPRVAVIELIANAYDAGATKVAISWPQSLDGLFTLEDNGVGMTRAQFAKRWTQLNYNRLQEQSSTVEFPEDVPNPPRRRAFGQYGKGRHACFCFGDKYEIETIRDGEKTAAVVTLERSAATPYSIEETAFSYDAPHGTRVRVQVTRNLLSEKQLREAVGSKFLVDPRFEITLNDQAVELEALAGKTTIELELEDGPIRIHALDGLMADRTTKLRGITYWVNGRMVGESSWDGLDANGAILDGRSAPAKRYSFVVEANVLQGDDIRADWRGFNSTDRTKRVLAAVRQEIVRQLEAFLRETTRDRKRAALASSRDVLRTMSPLSKKSLGEFVDSIQQKCPTLSEDVLAKTVEVFAKMETARSGHALLRQLAECSPDDLDRWSEIVEAWTAQDAKHVLDELGRRLALIRQLERLVNNKATDELHELQPLFEHGLWVFGPEYERVDFRSNRTLGTIIRDVFGGSQSSINNSRRRPDLIALPESTVGVYSADAYDEEGEANGFDRVLVVELKRGGFRITQDELFQGSKYATELRKGNKVGAGARITVYVLGSILADEAKEDVRHGDNIVVRPLIYDHFIRRAHNRTFHLLERVTAASPALVSDPDIEDVLAQGELFEEGLVNVAATQSTVSADPVPQP
jgi:hypothetical protein